MVTGPYLGGCVDVDSGDLQNLNGAADDVDESPDVTGICVPPGGDEDGVIFVAPFIQGQPHNGTLVLMSTAASPSDCQVDAWFDFNQNGDFTDPGEQVISNQSFLANSNTNLVGFNVPATAVPGQTFMRFRCSSAGGLTPTGFSPDGEVEDYLVTVQPAADLSVTLADSADPISTGNMLTYTVTVNNAGPSDAQNVVVTNTLPAGVTFSATTGCAEDLTGVPTCTLGTVTASSSKQFTLTVTVDHGTSGSLAYNTSVSSSIVDPTTGNNSASESTTV